MAWVRIHDGAMQNLKILRLTDSAFRLWVKGLCFCQTSLTDGLIPLEALAHLGAKRKDIAALTTPQVEGKAALWAIVDGFGYKVHDYLVWNDSKEVVQARQAKSRQRLAEWKAKHGNGVGNGVSNSARNTLETPTLTKPNLTKEKKEQERAVAEEVVGLWHACTTAPIPRCKALTPKRIRHISARCLAPQQWRELFDRVERSAFLRGQNDRGWRVDFDWLIGSVDNCAKVLEGRYDNRQPAPSAPARDYSWNCPHEPTCNGRNACHVKSTIEEARRATA